MSSQLEQILALLSQQQPESNMGLPGGFGNPEFDKPRPAPPEDSIVSPNPTQPLPDQVRMEGYRRLLTNFTYALGMGLESGNVNPRGTGQRTGAGIGSILQMPQKLEAARKQYALQQAQEAQRLAAAKASEAQANKSNLSTALLPAQLQQILANANKTNEQAKVIAPESAARIGSENAAANRNKYITTPQGLFDISGTSPAKVEGSEPIEFIVTPEIARKFEVPELEGQKVPTSTFNQIIKARNPKLQLSPVLDADGKLGLYSVNLEDGTKIRVGDAKTGLLSPEEEAQKIQIAKAAFDNRQPELTDPSDIRYIADQVDADSTGTMLTKMVGTNQRVRQQVISELRSRDSDLRILTAATRQLGETAHELMPNFDHALALTKDPGVQKAMGVVGSRWQQFIAGKIGSSDPALRGLPSGTIQKLNDLRTFVSLLQTGTARAHVGARGSAQLIVKFENLFNADRMDASTLKDSMASTQAFLKKYEEAVYGPSGKGPPPPSGVIEQYSPTAKSYRYSTDNGKTWQAGRAPR